LYRNNGWSYFIGYLKENIEDVVSFFEENIFIAIKMSIKNKYTLNEEQKSNSKNNNVVL
jgi:hypothetical protein